MSENTTLCASSAYDKKYYFNPDFGKLPSNIQKELQIMCVIFTEECGGILTLEFDKEGELLIKTEADESDYLYRFFHFLIPLYMYGFDRTDHLLNQNIQHKNA